MSDFKVVNRELTLRKFEYFCEVEQVKKLFDFYLDASIHVALAVVSLYAVSCYFMGIKCNTNLMAFIGLGTIVCYNFMKYGVEAEKYLVLSNKYHKAIQMFSFLCFGVSVYFMLRLQLDILLSIAVLGLVSLLYALPILPRYKNLRSLGLLKIFIVAFVWTGFTVFLPLKDAELHFNWDVWVLLTQRFFLVLALIIPFEIRDMHLDAPELKTLPQRLGVTGSKRFGYILTVLFFLASFLKDEVSLAEISSVCIVAVLLVLALFRTQESQPNYFSSFWVESIPIFWWILLIKTADFY
jgi:hypothetical protein